MRISGQKLVGQIRWLLEPPLCELHKTNRGNVGRMLFENVVLKDLTMSRADVYIYCMYNQKNGFHLQDAFKDIVKLLLICFRTTFSPLINV